MKHPGTTTKKFQRKIENFTCQNCGFKVTGNGYTNHCPNCLWSRHVDINPGDRAGACGGLMEPVNLELRKKQYIITHRCQKCGLESKNRPAENDNSNALLNLAGTLAKKAMF